jgi:hypothetical protein
VRRFFELSGEEHRHRNHLSATAGVTMEATLMATLTAAAALATAMTAAARATTAAALTTAMTTAARATTAAALTTAMTTAARASTAAALMAATMSDAESGHDEDLSLLDEVVGDDLAPFLSNDEHRLLAELLGPVEVWLKAYRTAGAEPTSYDYELEVPLDVREAIKRSGPPRSTLTRPSAGHSSRAFQVPLTPTWHATGGWKPCTPGCGWPVLMQSRTTAG